MKKSMLIAAGLLVAISCSKDNDLSNQNQPGLTNFGELKISENFNWSSSVKGNTTITLQHETNLATEGKPIWIIDENGRRLDQQTVYNDQATFNLTLPATGKSYYLYYPATGDSKVIAHTGNVNFKLYSDLFTNGEIIKNRPSFKGDKKSTQGTQAVTGTNLLSNGDFSSNSFSYQPSSSTASTLADNGQWYKYNNNFTHSTENGSKVVKAKNNKFTYIYQFVTVSATDSFAIQSDASGSAIAYIFWYQSDGSTTLGYDYFSRSGSTINSNGVVPSGAAYANVIMYVSDKGWVDNVHFESTPAIIDADNDGVADSDDDYPNDASRAYQSFFPTAGYQTLAFEDLWPAQGDYDFNDMVVSTKITYSEDANNNKVDATFEISLDAMGAGASNGLAIRLLNSSKQNFSGSIISSVTGDAILDQDNVNGIIVFNDAKQAQSEYYTNNGVGPSKAADVFTFTVTFNSNSNVQTIMPDIYIYRTDERGRETHLDGYYGSAMADVSLYNTKDDYNGTYNSANGLPWVVEVVTSDKSFAHPNEKVDILVAYPLFQQWAQNNGNSAINWMQSPALSKIFDLL